MPDADLWNFPVSKKKREENGNPAEPFSLHGISMTDTVLAEPRILSPSVVQALFRTAQEGLTNIRKHAGARQVRVELRYAPQTTILEILDDGRGSSGVSGGFGLAGLRERLEAIGGHVHAANRPEGGYVLKAEVTA